MRSQVEVEIEFDLKEERIKEEREIGMIGSEEEVVNLIPPSLPQKRQTFSDLQTPSLKIEYKDYHSVESEDAISLGAPKPLKEKLKIFPPRSLLTIQIRLTRPFP